MFSLDTTSVAAFLGVGSAVLLAFVLLSGRHRRIHARLRDLSGRDVESPTSEPMAHLARSALPKMAAPLVPTDEEERTRLQTRLIHAGLYGRQAMLFFLGTKMLLLIAPPLVGLAIGLMGIIPLQYGIIFGASLGIAGMVGPGIWLDRRKVNRQVSFRRALPDALDVLVICLEGGLSLPGSLRRVAEELGTAHPGLAAELNIAQREIQLGRSPGEALRQFGERCDLEEIRSLAAVVVQTERYGASLVKALRVHADTLRQNRIHHAEELAQKAAVKILFPTLLFIFPGIFVVVLGPGIIQIIDVFTNLRP